MKKGFSLLELMVAVGVLAVLLLLLAQAFDVFSKTVASGRSGVKMFEEARVAAALMKREVGSAIVRENSGLSFNIQNTSSPVGTVLQFSIPAENTAILTNMSLLKHICYLWDPERNTLHRSESRNGESPTPSETQSQVPILSHVVNFEVLVYETGLDSSPHNQWSDTNRLPQYLEVRLGVIDEQDAPAFQKDPSLTNKIRWFRVAAPLKHYGIYDHRDY